MKKQLVLRRLPFWVALAAAYALIPLSDQSYGGQFLQLYAILPGLSFVIAWVYGLVNRFRWTLPAGACVLFLPSALGYYNATAWVFPLIYGAVVGLGCFLGSLWNKPKT